MALKLYSDSDIQDIANAIRGKNGSSDTYKVSQMASAITAIPTGGVTPTGTKQISITQNGTTTEDVTNYASAQITTNVPNSYTSSDEGKVVSSGALVSQSSQTVTENGTYDTTLKNEVVVNVSGSGGGYSLDDLATNAEPSGVLNISVPVGTYAFHSKTNITKLTGSTTSIGDYAFEQCSGITEIDLPNCTQLGVYAFRTCSNLETVKLPNVLTIGSTGFRDCPKLNVVVLPKITAMSGNVFYSCTQLETADFFAPASIQANLFNNTPALNKLILRKTDSITTLANINAFAGSPFASGGTGGTLYVPSSLMSSYQSATNWSTILGYANNQILPIEGSIYENAYADGTPISA